MAFTHVQTFSWSNGGTPQTKSVSLTGDGEDNRSFTAGPNATTQVNLAFVKTALKSLYILSDVALTLKTNDSGSPQDTIAIAANSPFTWYTGSGEANPFADNVTTTYWVNGTAGAATVFVGLLVDATP